jgi:hypothetical protein
VTPTSTPTPPAPVPALAAAWSPTELALQLLPAGGGPGGTAVLTVANDLSAPVTDLTVTLTEQAPPLDSVLMSPTIAGDGWSFVSGGGGTMVIAWTGILEPGQSTPGVTIRFGTDDLGSSGSADITATPAATGATSTPATIHIAYPQTPSS